MSRKELLLQLINMSKPVPFLNAELGKMIWDSNSELVVLKLDDVYFLLKKYLDKKVFASDLEEWAEAIECREDIGFEKEYSELISNIIFHLANPAVYGEITDRVACQLISKLQEAKNS